MKSQTIIIVGGDGFCGWPTSLFLAARGHKVVIVDNLSRRRIDKELDSFSLTPISSIENRVSKASELFGAVSFQNIDVANSYENLLKLIINIKPDTIIQFGEQRAAPYSMIGDIERRYTVDNNIRGTHNICSAIIESDLDIHLVHLGTMGVYGYSKDFGSIPEGYLDVTIKSTLKDVGILYPSNPGSIYHMSKCLDQLLFQFYNKNWGLRVTDLHQGIVWGIETHETKLSEVLVNRFDYDGIYGTVLNRFIAQAANQFPLTVYGTGGQSRAFIHIQDTAKCISLAIDNPPIDNSRVRIFNQVSEVRKVYELAEIISTQYDCEIQYVDNPRKELPDNELEVSNAGLVSLGFSPLTLDNSLVDDVKYIADVTKSSFDSSNILTSPEW
jgi:UDP-sulfoquinovose synthase